MLIKHSISLEGNIFFFPVASLFNHYHHVVVPLHSQADPEAEKKDEADPADQTEVLCFRPLNCILCSLAFKLLKQVFVCLLPEQTAKEDEKDEEGMWEETFKTFVDSKPNGQLKLT